MTAELVLASASPRRRELLARLGVEFEVLPSDVPELPEAGESPAQFAGRVARDKAVEVAGWRPTAVVLAADTIVVQDGVIFGKPRDRADARRMLTALAAADHQVLTAVTLVAPGRPIVETLVTSAVRFRALADAEIEAYLDSAEPYDKAGAYALQGGGGRFIEAIDGSQSNIVGLPLLAVAELLRPYYSIAPVVEPELV